MGKRYETNAGVKLTKKQSKLIMDFEELMSRWDENIAINAVSGNLELMLLGDTKQNPYPEKTKDDAFNPENCINHRSFDEISSDGGGW